MPKAVKKSAQDATHRLVGLEVFEVSMVDSPANKRRWLVVKSENGMSTRQKLNLEDDGTLTKGSFKQKPKMKSAISSAIGSLQKLLESIDDAEDGAPFAKGIKSVMDKLGPYIGGGDDKSDDKDADKSKKDDAKKQEVPAHAMDLLSALEEKLIAEVKAAEPEPAHKAATTALNAKVDSVVKAVQALTQVVKTSRSATKPPKQTSQGANENTVTKSKKPLWLPDMASPEIPDDEKFV